MWKIVTMLLLTSMIMFACQTDESAEPKQEESSSYHPLGYADDGAIERRGKIPTGKDSYFKRTTEEEFRNAKYGVTNRSHDNDFNNEDAMDVVEKVNELKEITMAQAFSTDDRMYVAVMINPYDLRDETIPEKIEAKVKQVSDKDLIVYTNNNTWDQMKNIHSRQEASEAPQKIRDRLRNFFNQ